MLANPLSLLVACFCVFFAQAKTVTQLFNLDPTSHLALSAINSVSAFVHACGTTRFLAASTNVDGASISFAFKGTGLTLNVITDADRGLYTITFDNQPTEISGVSTTQACTPIFTRSNLVYGDHVLTVQSKNQTLTGGGFSAKLEYLSIDYTVPDDVSTTGSAGPSTSTTLPLSGNQDTAVTSNALSGGTIAAIIISVILFLIVLVLAFLLYKAKTTHTPIMTGLGYGSGPELVPKSPAPVSFHSTPYGGHAEPMAIETPYDLPPPSAGYHQPSGPVYNQAPGANYLH